MRDGQQQAFALLHYTFGFCLCLKDAVAVATFPAYVSQDVDHENGCRENGEQSESDYPDDHSPS